MQDEKSSRSVKRFHVVLIFLILITVGITAWAVISRMSGGPCTIAVDRKPIVCVATHSAAKTVISKVKFGKTNGIPRRSVRFAQSISIRSAPKNSELTSISEASDILEKALIVEADAFAITADGNPVAALPTKEQAEETLRLVKRIHEQELGILESESTFKEKILIDKMFVEVGKLCESTKEAARVLTSTSEKSLVHIMQLGDRAIKLAEQYGVPINELKGLNPRLNLDQLNEGDQLLIRRAKLPITVVSKARVTKIITVMPPPEARGARTGKRRIQILVTYENGEPVSEDIISQVTIWGRTTLRKKAAPSPALKASESEKKLSPTD